MLFFGPGAHLSDEDITSFYDDFHKGYQRYSNDVEIFIMGDSNARLGKFSHDVNIHGKFVTNKNMAHFLGFLSLTRLTFVNGIFSKGTPTYEIAGKKKSIINFGLTNFKEKVKKFEI